MKAGKQKLNKNHLLYKQLIFFFTGVFFILITVLFQPKFSPAPWMTYRNFDVPGQKNFINYLTPGVKDVSTGTVYNFKHKNYILLLIILFVFFPLMFYFRVASDLDFKLKTYRYITQWLTFVIARMGIFRVTGICPVKRSGLGIFPFMNCQSCELATGACPLGTFQMSLLNKQIPFVLIGQTILVGIISGRWVCGWLCPYGFLSDIFDKISRKKVKLPHFLTWFKYIYTAVFLVSSISYFFIDDVKTLFYCTFLCPVGFYYGVLEYALTTGLHSLVKEFPFIHYMLLYHFLIGLLVLVGSAKIGGRFFCKYFCPLGTIYGLFTANAFYRITLNSNKCKGCKKCIDVCPMHINVLKRDHLTVSSCISCGRCKKVCPTDKIQYSIDLLQNNKAQRA